MKIADKLSFIDNSILITVALIRKEFKKTNPEIDREVDRFNTELDGEYCLLCRFLFPNNPEKWKFDPQVENLKKTIHHLNGKREDNRPLNKCKAHLLCNDRDRWNTDYELISHQILTRNYNLAKEGRYVDIENVIKEIHLQNERELNSRTHPESESNKLYLKTANEEMLTKTNDYGEYPYGSIIQNVAFLHYQSMGGKAKGGGGSPNAARKAVDMLCSEYGEYEIVQGDKGRVIRKRQK